MNLDVSKLSPADEWEPDFEDGTIEGVLRMVHHGNVNTVARTGEMFNRADLLCCALGRKALDVMLRRGWQPLRYDDGWGIAFHRPMPTRLTWLRWPDPFTALVESDRWYRENVENVENQTAEAVP